MHTTTERQAPGWLLPRPHAIAPAADDLRLLAGMPVRLRGPTGSGLHDISAQLGEMVQRRHALTLAFAVEQAAAYELLIGAPTVAAATPAAATPEAYTLSVTASGAAASAIDEAGLRWAAMSFFQLCYRQDADVIAAGCHIDDAPRYPWRGFMVDAGRAPSSLASLKRLISLCASFKLNHCVYREGDDELNAVAYSTTPLGSQNPCALSLDELDALIDHGRRHGVAVVPEIECLGHSQAKARHFPELVEGGIQTRYGDVATHTRKAHLRPSDPRSYDLLACIFQEWLPRQQTDYVHLGMDEVALPEAVQRAHLAGLLPRLEDLGRTHGRDLQPIVWADAPQTPDGWEARVVRCLWHYAEHNDIGRLGLDNSHLIGQGLLDLVAPGCEQQVIMAGGSGSFHRPYGKNGIEVAIENLADWSRFGREHPNFIGLLAVQWGGNMLDMWLPDFIAAADFGWTPPEAFSMNEYDKLVHEHMVGLDPVFPRVREAADAPCWDGIWLRDGRFHHEVAPAGEE
jgi:hypothetical protein